MRVEFRGHYVNLRGETRDERKVLSEMYKHGIRVWGGGSYLSFSSNKPADKNEEKLELIKILCIDRKRILIQQTSPMYYSGSGMDSLDKILEIIGGSEFTTNSEEVEA